MIEQRCAAPAGCLRGVMGVFLVSALSASACASTGCLPALPTGAVIENEPSCGVPVDNYNGGCRSPSNAALLVPNNATISGTLTDDVISAFDTDTYEFDIAWPGGNVTVKAWAGFPVYAVIDDLNCSTPLLAVGLSAGCTPAEARLISLPPGRHRLMITSHPATLACGSAYVATISTCPCPGDFNADCTVNTSDLIMLLGRFGNDGLAPYTIGDLNNDRKVDTGDLVTFLSRFGCTG